MFENHPYKLLITVNFVIFLGSRSCIKAEYVKVHVKLLNGFLYKWHQYCNQQLFANPDDAIYYEILQSVLVCKYWWSNILRKPIKYYYILKSRKITVPLLLEIKKKRWMIHKSIVILLISCPGSSPHRLLYHPIHNNNYLLAAPHHPLSWWKGCSTHHRTAIHRQYIVQLSFSAVTATVGLLACLVLCSTSTADDIDQQWWCIAGGPLPI